MRIIAESPDECETAGMIFSCGQTNAPDFVSSAVDFSKIKPAPVENLIEFPNYLENKMKNLFLVERWGSS
jgi:hypothetical protein